MEKFCNQGDRADYEATYEGSAESLSNIVSLSWARYEEEDRKGE